MIIKINEYIVSGVHGLTPKEKKLPQRFKVDVEATLRVKSLKEDSIGNTVDYRDIKNVIQEIIEGESCNLLETLALRIVGRITENRNISSVNVVVSKLDIWENGFPSVAVTEQDI